MVAWSFYPRVGGSVTTVMQLSEALLEKGIEVDIIAPLLIKDAHIKERRFLDERIRMHWVTSSMARGYSDFYSRLIFFLKMTVKIMRLSREIDVFHAHDFNVSFFSALFGTSKPVVAVFGADPLFEMAYFHKKKAMDYASFSENKIVLVLQIMLKKLIAGMSKNRLIVISLNEALERIIKKYYSGMTRTIPVGLNLNLYREKRFGKSRRSDVLLVVTRFISWKGVERAIEAFEMVKKVKPEVSLVIIGDGPLTAYYLTKYKNYNGVHFIRVQDYKDVIEYYDTASILLVTSEYETFGINISEAMASGLPIVASDLDAFADRLMNDVNCFLIQEPKAESFASKIVTLLDHPQTREAMAQKAQEKIRNHCLDRTRDAYIDLYQALLLRRERQSETE